MSVITGCKNPLAQNYNPQATQDNYSCQYLMKNQGNCHYFTDYVPSDAGDRSFTLSYSVKGNSWVFFHDYLPDLYFHTREKLWSLKDSQIYQHNVGNPGQYYGATPKPFFIDVVFQGGQDMILETVNWVSEFLQSGADQPFQTLTHITIWNSTQHSGRIPLSGTLYDESQEVRRTKGEWVFNDFRDTLAQKGVQFLLDLFHDYALDTTKQASDPGWYERELLTDKWFCVRFEFDNSAVANIVLHETTVQAIKSAR